MPVERMAEGYLAVMGSQGFMTERENGLWKSIFVKRLAVCPVWMEDAAMLIRRSQRVGGILVRKGRPQESETGSTRGISGNWHQLVGGCRERMPCTAEQSLLAGKKTERERSLFIGDIGEAAIITGSVTGAGYRTER